MLQVWVLKLIKFSTRLYINQPILPRPDLTSVHEEIQKARTLVNYYKNDTAQDFPQNSNEFKLLGLMMNKLDDTFSLRG